MNTRCLLIEVRAGFRKSKFRHVPAWCVHPKASSTSKGKVLYAAASSLRHTARQPLCLLHSLVRPSKPAGPGFDAASKYVTLRSCLVLPQTPRRTDGEAGCSGANIVQYLWLSSRGRHLTGHADLSPVIDELDETSGGHVDESCISAPCRLTCEAPPFSHGRRRLHDVPRGVRAPEPRFCGRSSVFQNPAVLVHRPMPLRVMIGAVAAGQPRANMH
ncbi:hypothetical protein VTG60DRAFT_3080 [Thermothelomyces hinnuleus]